MAADKYPRIFLRQMEAVVFIILQIFYATLTVLKIGEYQSRMGNIRSRDAFRLVTCEQKYLMDYNGS